MLTFAIGDIHGCLDQLTELLAQCRRFAKGQPSKFIFLGDYIDRGPDSRGVIQTIMDMQAADPANVIALAGNHEELLRHWHIDDGMGRWLVNGGGVTLRSYGVTSPKDLPPDHLAWLTGLPLFYEDAQRLFVHAGIRPGVPLEQQTRDDMLWIRAEFLDSTVNHGKLVVHGHSPRRDRKPECLDNRVNVDTGAFRGGSLTAVIFTDSQRMPIDFLQALPLNAD